MTIPDLVEVYTLEELILACKETFEQANPGLLQSESDYYTPVIEAQAEREFRLRTEINKNFKNQFWMIAEGEWLDFAASEFNVERLQGSKPWARFTFTLSETSEIDITIPDGLVLGSDDGLTAYTTEEFTVPAGSLSVEVTAELELYVVSSATKTEQILTLLPYLAEVKQLESWHDGDTVEDDARLRARVSLSLEGISGAGPYKAYTKFALDADSRINDVLIFETDGRVQIVIDSDEWDAVLADRVTLAVSAEEKRPLNDKTDIYQATKVLFSVQAVLSIKDEYSTADVVARSKAEVQKIQGTKIAEPISQARIIEALFVDGVKDINITSPGANLEVSQTEVLKLDTVEVSYA